MPIKTDVLLVKMLQRPLATLMKSNENRHHLAGMKSSGAPPFFRCVEHLWGLSEPSLFFKRKKTVVNLTEKQYKVHGELLWVEFWLNL